MGLDDSSISIPTIDPLPTRYFTSLILGHVGRDGIYVHIQFTTNWVDCVSPHVLKYSRNKCKVLAYCSSAADARDNIKGKLQDIKERGDIRRYCCLNRI